MEKRWPSPLALLHLLMSDLLVTRTLIDHLFWNKFEKQWLKTTDGNKLQFNGRVVSKAKLKSQLYKNCDYHVAWSWNWVTFNSTPLFPIIRYMQMLSSCFFGNFFSSKITQCYFMSNIHRYSSMLSVNYSFAIPQSLLSIIHLVGVERSDRMDGGRLRLGGLRHWRRRIQQAADGRVLRLKSKFYNQLEYIFFYINE